MSRYDDPYASGSPSSPIRRASARSSTAQDQVPQRVAAPQFSAYANQPTGEPQEQDANDLLWYGSCIVLGLACVGVLVFWLWRIFTVPADSTKLLLLFVIIAIYALCAAFGWLWGRYQNAPVQAELEQQVGALQEQIRTFQQQVGHLTRENQGLQQALSQQNAVATRTDPSQSAVTVRRAPLPDTPQKATPAAPVIPEGSIYDHQIEPADSSDLALHPHEKRFPAPGEPNTLGYNWQLIGASRRGYGHGYEGKYREDDFQVKILNDQSAGPALAVVAIADGVSSREFSRKGALASVEGATAITEQQVARLKMLLSRNGSQEDLRTAAANVLLESLRSAANAVKYAARNAGVSVDELHATLLVFLAAPLNPDQLFLARVQVGDGAMFGVRNGSNGNEPLKTRWGQLLAPQIQATGNEVQPFMRSQERDWYQFMQFDTLSALVGVMAMTDGIADDIEPPPSRPGEPEADEFSMVDRFHQTYVLPTLQSPRPADQLVKFIGYRRSQSIDDRTLVYLYRK